MGNSLYLLGTLVFGTYYGMIPLVLGSRLALIFPLALDHCVMVSIVYSCSFCTHLNVTDTLSACYLDLQPLILNSKVAMGRSTDISSPDNSSSRLATCSLYL